MHPKRWLLCAPLAVLLLAPTPAVFCAGQQPSPPPSETDRERREREERARRERDALHQKQTRDGNAGTQLADSKRRTEARQELEKSLLTVSDARETDRGIVVPLDDTLFEPGAADIREAARSKITKIGQILAARPDARLHIDGYVDAADGEEVRRVAEQRAQAIRDLLVAAGVSGGQVSASSISEARPVASSDTTRGRQRNRRVEIVVVDTGTLPARP